MAKKASSKTFIGKAITLTWEDAWQSMEYYDSQEIKQAPAMLIMSLGLCIRDDEHAVSLAMDCLPDGRFRTTKTVPRGMVRKIEAFK